MKYLCYKNWKSHSRQEPRAKSQPVICHNHNLCLYLFLSLSLSLGLVFLGGPFSVKLCWIYQWLCCALVTITTSLSPYPLQIGEEVKSVKFRSFYFQLLGGKKEVGSGNTHFLFEDAYHLEIRMTHHRRRWILEWSCVPSPSSCSSCFRNPWLKLLLSTHLKVSLPQLSLFSAFSAHTVYRNMDQYYLLLGLWWCLIQTLLFHFFCNPLHLLPFVLIEICFVGMWNSSPVIFR